MNPDGRMYRWRTLSAEERKAALASRIEQRQPWHGPAHFPSETDHYLITSACYEHRSIIGSTPVRMSEFESQLVRLAEIACEQVYSWTILPNHYHLLVRASNLKGLLSSIGLLHGRTSHRWNGNDDSRARKVWYRAAETGMKSESHFWASLNYVLHNAVRHGYVERWQDWPYSNAATYLDTVGRHEAERRWKEFPLLDFGKGWDPPEL